MGLFGKIIKNAVGDGISKAVSGAVEKGVKSAIQPKVNEWSEKLTDAATKDIDASVNSINAASEALDEASKETKKIDFGALNDALEKLAKSAEQYEKTQPSEGKSEAYRDTYENGNADYFAGIIAKNFPDAEVKLSVPVSEITADIPAKVKPVDVLVCKGGAAKAAIILTPKNSYKAAAVVNTMNACEKAGIKAYRFMEEFSNKEEYVVGRIGQSL